MTDTSRVEHATFTDEGAAVGNDHRYDTVVLEYHGVVNWLIACLEGITLRRSFMRFGCLNSITLHAGLDDEMFLEIRLIQNGIAIGRGRRRSPDRRLTGV